MLPLALVQVTPQAPQLDVVFRGTSQPLVTLLSQLAKPAVQLMVQVPALQPGVPLLELQTLPHVPQFSGSVFRFFSQPLEYSPSQFEKPELHDATAQLPELQLALPFATKHALPQAPQWLVLLLVFTSQPLPALPSQSAVGGTQELMPQTPFTQLGVAPPGLGQTLPHAPQWLTFVLVLTSQPFATLLSQLAKLPVQLMVQLPELHPGVPLLELQTLPQAPQ